MKEDNGYLYCIDKINANDIDDSIIELLKKIISIKKYLYDTNKLNDESSSIIAIVITLFNTTSVFPPQIENWKKYAEDYLKIDYIRLLEDLFNIPYKKTKSFINNIFNQELNNKSSFKLFKDKKANLINKNSMNDYNNFNDLTKEETYETFKIYYRYFIDSLDSNFLPILLIYNKKNINTIEKRIIYFLTEICFRTWNFKNDINLLYATQYMLALENKKLIKSHNVVGSSNVKYINPSMVPELLYKKYKI